MQKKGYRSLSNRDIEITDPLFSHYVDMIADTILPYQWDILNDRIESVEPSHCLNNFRIAAGEIEGTFYGAVFKDTDIYKWLEAASYCIESGKGDKFLPLADEVIDLIIRAQQPDGYLNTYYTIMRPGERWTNLMEGHELYSAGHLIEAAVAYYRATEKRKLLDAAIRCADLITRTFGPGRHQKHGYPGHQEIELALVKLYRATNEKRYLDTARYFIDQRGKQPNYFHSEIRNRHGAGIFPELAKYDLKYAQAHMPPVQQRSVEGHAVRAMYMCAAMADLALEYEDEQLQKACTALWENTTEKRMFITGGIGSSGYLERFTSDYHLPNDSAYCETCASVGLMMFGQRMASLTGDARFYNAVERALHNTVLAGISADGLRYFYVNPLEVQPDVCLPSTSMEHVKPERQQWFSVACCPTNAARTLASLGQYIYAEDDQDLCIHQFISSKVRTKHAGRLVHLSMDADIMQTGSVRIQSDAPIRLRVRIPAYAEHPGCSLNGTPYELSVKKGYACFDLKKASEIVLDLHAAPRWIAANDQVRENAAKTALTAGPFVYCLEEADNQDNLAAVSVLPNTEVSLEGELNELPGNVPKLGYEGWRIASGVEKLYGSPAYALEPVHLVSVPYCLWCNRKPGEMLVWKKVRL